MEAVGREAAAADDAERGGERAPLLLLALCAAVGACAGLVACGYRFLLVWAEKLQALIAGLSRTTLGFPLALAALAALGYLAGRITRAEPLIRGSGIPQVKGQLMGVFRPRWLRVLLLKIAGGALCAVGGLSLGREGPSIQLGAMASQGLCAPLSLSEDDRRTLLVCGACAGLAAAFNAPLAGLMFSLEEMYRRVENRKAFTAMLASLAGAFAAMLLFGQGPVLDVRGVDGLPLAYTPVYLLMGVLTGLAGAGYNRVLAGAQRLYKRLPVSDAVRVMIPFLLAGLIAPFLPQVLGSGGALLPALLGGQYALPMLLLLLAGKFLFSMASFGSGAPGGIFFPLLILGALLGGAVCAALSPVLPEGAVINFVLMGMAGMFAGIVRAPVTGILLVVEMSGAITQLAGVSVVACVACVTATALRVPPVYDQLLQAILPKAAEKEDAHGGVSKDVHV